MGKAGKLRRKNDKLAAKRAKKAANKAYYQKLRELGQNSKSKRAQKNNSKTKKVATTSHPLGACGNFGCSRCNPSLLLIKHVVSQRYITKVR